MSSQAIATPARGLPDLPSPVDLHTFANSPWSDHDNPDDSVPARNNDIEHIQTSDEPRQGRPSWAAMDVRQRNQAVGNLLAALVPVDQTQTATTNPPTNPPVFTNEDKQDTEPPTYSHSPPPHVEPSTPNGGPDPSSTIPLPPLPALANNDFLDENMNPSFHPALQHSTLENHAPLMTLETLPGEVPALPLQEQIPLELSQDLIAERREIEAFAKIEFEDGNYYITTYACELGRDAFAYRAALMRAEQARNAEQDRAQSSSGRRSDGIPRPENSQVQGSVVSEAGGFGGVDDKPGLDDVEQDHAHPLHSHSSERSAGSVVKPQEVLINPPLIPFDYHKMAELQAQQERENDAGQDDEQPAPVTADHIPDAHNCPLIPIHAMRNFQKSEVENHRSISRRHVKIEWDFDKDCFLLRVLGRNGAFLEDQYLQRGGVKRLRDGSRIQISNVWMTFRLPNRKASPVSEESEREDKIQSPLVQRSTSPTSNEQDRSISPSRTGKTKTKITLTTGQKTTPVVPDLLLGPDGQPVPPRKRGPGRPPKDGIMSTRERREREKALKLAEAKAANGGATPPPMMKGKFPKTIIKEEIVKEDPKPEKRKYKKRKRSEEPESREVMPSIEGGDIDLPSEVEKQPPPPKKARASKSPSPEYPPAETLTEEQLARPSEPYARLIYDILLDIHPKALPLKQIYRALKLKFPFFVHRVDSEGWQSSVRHNLNQEWNKLFEKGEKEGKGFAWKAIPGALQPQAERRRAAQQAAASKPKPTPTPRQHTQGPPPPLNWQNSTPYPQQNGMPPRGPPPPFFVQGPNGPVPPPPAGMAWGPPPAGGIPPASSNMSGTGPPPGPHSQNHPSFLPASQSGPSSYHPQQPSHPPTQHGGPLPPPFMTNQNVVAGPSSVHPIPPPPPSSSSASRNMPCTLDGLVAIRRFETAMYEQVGHPEKNAQWREIFHSVKRRLLHGAPHSLMPEGNSKQEDTIMSHVASFIDRFKNPAFVGFSSDPISSTASPAPNLPSGAQQGNGVHTTPKTPPNPGQVSAVQSAPIASQAVPPDSKATPSLPPSVGQASPHVPANDSHEAVSAASTKVEENDNIAGTTAGTSAGQ